MKFVVFSQYTGMLDLIENYLKKEGIPFGTLKGNMSIAKRQSMIDRFNSDPECRVFCASLLAGGVGIDLTAANAVIHYDRWWNPAREEQATARVHRMGQKNVVQVFRLITKGTLEEKIHQLISRKRELATSLIQEDEAGIIKQLDRSQLAELLRL
jgi:SNF2 family DNA or RNA helicase